MNYQRHYNLLIEKGKNRILVGYSEKHHIVPKCLGGDNSKENIVRLTPEEHYVAHQLLVNIYPGNYKLLYACMSMINTSKNTPRKNKMYGWLRREFAKASSEFHTGKIVSLEARANMSKARTGIKTKPHSYETKQKMSLASKGKIKSIAHKDALSKAKLGIKRGPHSEDHRSKISASNKRRDVGYLHSEKNNKLRVEKLRIALNKEDYRKGKSMEMKKLWELRRIGLAPNRNPINKNKNLKS